MYFLLQIKIQLLYLTNKYKMGIYINDQDTLIEHAQLSALYIYFTHTYSLGFLITEAWCTIFIISE